MDRNEKFLKKLQVAEFNKVASAVLRIRERNTAGLDIIKLQGQDGMYRARIGSIRIVFQDIKSQIIILEINRRSEKTYKNF